MLKTAYPDLLEYRRTVSDLYATLRHSSLSLPVRCTQFRAGRDRLFATHPQSALTVGQKATFTGLPYYPYDPAWRFTAAVDPAVEPAIIPVETQHDGVIRWQRFGKVHFKMGNSRFLFRYSGFSAMAAASFCPFAIRPMGRQVILVVVTCSIQSSTPIWDKRQPAN